MQQAFKTYINHRMMKRKLLMVCLVLVGCMPLQQARAQEQEIEQLVLNIEKLLQFRKILSDMKEGYEVLAQGYQMVKDISEGNFNLHKTFLDGLMAVSPAVQRYERLAQIIRMQAQLVKEYKAAYKQFQGSNLFSIDELQYLDRVYRQLFNQSLQQLSDLTTIVTAGKLRMSDEERLASIDRLYDEMQEQLLFLRRFNHSTSALLLQRTKENNDVKGLHRLFEK
jgi:hypothetical protein